MNKSLMLSVDYFRLVLGFFIGLLAETLARLVLWLSRGELSVNFDYLRAPESKFKFQIIEDQTTEACCEMIRDMAKTLRDDDIDLYDDWDGGYMCGRSSAYVDVINAIERGAWRDRNKDKSNASD